MTVPWMMSAGGVVQSWALLGLTVFSQGGGNGISYRSHFSSNLTLALLPTRRLLWLILWNMFCFLNWRTVASQCCLFLIYSKVNVTLAHTPLFWISFTVRSPQSARHWVDVLHSMFLVVICVIHKINNAHVSIPMSQFIPPSLPLNDPVVHSIHLCLSFCFVNWTIYAIFLGFTCMHEYMFVFLFLTYFTLYDSL